MKKIFTILGIASAFLLNAQVLKEQFTGTGTLIANGWVTHSGTIPGQVSILTTPSDSGNSLSYAGLEASVGNRTSIIAGNTEDVNKALPAPIAGTTYYSAIIKPLNNTAFNPAGDYFLALGSAAGAVVTVLPARLYIKPGTAANTFNLGILNQSGGTVTPSFGATDYPVGTSVFVAVKYDLAANSASLFVNPVPGQAEPVATATNATGTTAAPASIASIAIRQGGTATSGTGNVEIDEIRVGSTFASVTTANLAVSDTNLAKVKLLKNSNVNNSLTFGAKANVQILNANGQVVRTAAVSENSTLDVSSLNKGVYIVTGEVNGQKVSQKIIKN